MTCDDYHCLFHPAEGILWLLYLEVSFYSKYKCFECFQEIKDLNEMITEIGGELGKIAEEEKRQTHDDIKVLEVKCWLNMMDIMLLKMSMILLT